MDRKRSVLFQTHLPLPQIRSKCQNMPKVEFFYSFPNMGCGYSKLVSLDTGDSKESIAIRRCPQFEKTVNK